MAEKVGRYGGYLRYLGLGRYDPGPIPPQSFWWDTLVPWDTPVDNLRYRYPNTNTWGGEFRYICGQLRANEIIGYLQGRSGGSTQPTQPTFSTHYVLPDCFSRLRITNKSPHHDTAIPLIFSSHISRGHLSSWSQFGAQDYLAVVYVYGMFEKRGVGCIK